MAIGVVEEDCCVSGVRGWHGGDCEGEGDEGSEKEWEEGKVHFGFL